jgi:hypothetical protein
LKYMKLDDVQRQDLLESLAGMTSFLYEVFGPLSAEEASTPGPDGSFSPVEQVWHLADLEREGFGVRLERLRVEDHPQLPDFDGDRIAKERNYRALSLRDGLSAFEMARKANLQTLRSLPLEAWARSGSQEGVGPVSLCDIPLFILQHDQAHVAEIRAWIEVCGQRNDA